MHRRPRRVRRIGQDSQQNRQQRERVHGRASPWSAEKSIGARLPRKAGSPS
jgi:hypothetical protein